MSISAMRVQLIRFTPAPEQIVSLGARLCYSGLSIEKLQARAENESEDFLSGVLQSGHHSILEHATFTFAMEGVSRILLAQLTRHRLASFSVQSQRYVSKESGFDYVLPPSIAALGEEAVARYESQMQIMHAWYVDWQQRLGGKGESSNEDARFVLPGACETRMILTMNARELLHFFSLRCCKRAQWEIRALADRMLSLSHQAAPALFQSAGPSCLFGTCSEGKRTCGQPGEMRAHIRELRGDG